MFTIRTQPVIDPVPTKQFYTNNTGVKVWWGVIVSVLFWDDSINPISITLRTILKGRNVIVLHFEQEGVVEAWEQQRGAQRVLVPAEAV